jgi:hypothetical protein
MKKTPTPLNGRCTQPHNAPCFAAIRGRAVNARDRVDRSRTLTSRDFPIYRKPLWNRCFYAFLKCDFEFPQTKKSTPIDPHIACEMDRCVGFTQGENFFHRSACKGATRRSQRPKTSESSTEVIRVSVVGASIGWWRQAFSSARVKTISLRRGVRAVR